MFSEKVIYLIRGCFDLVLQLKCAECRYWNQQSPGKIICRQQFEFRVDNTGNITRIRNLVYTFPTVQGTNQYLKNDGAGNLTWEPAPKPVVHIFSIVNSGMTAWAIDNAADYQAATNLNPTLVLYRGFTYQFKITATGHPFRIAVSKWRRSLYNRPFPEYYR